jgi:archaellum component FlaG (FlaF/FlaG flagellin family)
MRLMKFISILLSFITFVLVACKSPGRKENSSDVKSFIVSPSVARFSISNGETFDTTFFIKNIGKEKLMITEIATACGCVAGRVRDSTVMPNDSIPLSVTFKPNPGDSGKLARFITIRTNGTPPIQSVELQGDVH